MPKQADHDFKAMDHEALHPQVDGGPRAAPSSTEEMVRQQILGEIPGATLAEQNERRSLYGLEPLKRDAMDEWLEKGLAV